MLEYVEGRRKFKMKSIETYMWNSSSHKGISLDKVENVNLDPTPNNNNASSPVEFAILKLCSVQEEFGNSHDGYHFRIKFQPC